MKEQLTFDRVAGRQQLIAFVDAIDYHVSKHNNRSPEIIDLDYILSAALRGDVQCWVGQGLYAVSSIVKRPAQGASFLSIDFVCGENLKDGWLALINMFAAHAVQVGAKGVFCNMRPGLVKMLRLKAHVHSIGVSLTWR